MNINEIVAIVDYDRVVAENAQLKADLDNKCDDCSCELLAERDKLKSQLAESMELLGLVIEDIGEVVKDNVLCDKCQNLNGTECCVANYGGACGKDGNLYKYKHADRYEKLKGEVEKKC